jgi:hypothetical protein
LDVDIDLRSPRAMQGILAGVVLLGFVADVRFVVLIAAVGLLATFARIERSQTVTWATETALLVLSALLFLISRAGWAWLFTMIAAGVAALAAMAGVWIAPDRGWGPTS